jgi:hypothetical protein
MLRCTRLDLARLQKLIWHPNFSEWVPRSNRPLHVFHDKIISFIDPIGTQRVISAKEGLGDSKLSSNFGPMQA